MSGEENAFDDNALKKLMHKYLSVLSFQSKSYERLPYTFLNLATSN